MATELVGRIEAAEIDRDRYVVTALGPLDERTVGDLRDVLVPVAAADGAIVLLDLDGAHGFDVAALAIVGVAAHLVSRRGGRLCIVTRSGQVRGLVDDSGLADIVDIVPTLRQAISRD